MTFANMTISARGMIGGLMRSFVGIIHPQGVQKSVKKRQKITSELLEGLVLKKVPEELRALSKLMVNIIYD